MDWDVENTVIIIVFTQSWTQQIRVIQQGKKCVALYGPVLARMKEHYFFP